MDGHYNAPFTPKRPKGPARRAKDPRPPPPPPPPRPPVPTFEDIEPINYEHTDTGLEEADKINRKIAKIYTEIAECRKELYDEKNNNNISDAAGFALAMEPVKEIITNLRSQGALLRDQVRKVPAVPFEEPDVFSHDII